MNLYEIQKELCKLCDELGRIVDELHSHFREEEEETKHETVKLRLVTNNGMGRSVLTPLKYSSSGLKRNPTLYKRMVECGYSLDDIKKLFGEKSHIKAKIAFGNERFTDIEAEKLTELFHLDEKERGVYFWRGIIETSPR